MSAARPDLDRLKKTDRHLLIEALQEIGLGGIVERKAKASVYGFRMEEEREVSPYGFYWNRQAQVWSFHCERLRIHTKWDLETAIGECKVEMRLLQAAEKAFQAWKQSKSEKRWRDYQAALAALYFRA